MNIGLATAPINIKPAGAEAVSTTGAGVAFTMPPAPRSTFLLVTVAVTAATGTLLVVLEGNQNSNASPSAGNWFELAMFGSDGVRTWNLGALPTPFAAAATVSQLVSLAPMIRYRSIIAGGSVTFSLTSQFVINPDAA